MVAERLKKMQQKANKNASKNLKKDRVGHKIRLIQEEKGRNRRVIFSSIPALTFLAFYLKPGEYLPWVLAGLGVFFVLCLTALYTGNKKLDKKIFLLELSAKRDGIEL